MAGIQVQRERRQGAEGRRRPMGIALCSLWLGAFAVPATGSAPEYARMDPVGGVEASAGVLGWSVPEGTTNDSPYVVEYADEITGPWTRLASSNITYASATQAVLQLDSAGITTRYYRVGVEVD